MSHSTTPSSLYAHESSTCLSPKLGNAKLTKMHRNKRLKRPKDFTLHPVPTNLRFTNSAMEKFFRTADFSFERSEAAVATT